MAGLPWIRVEVILPHHPKVERLEKELGIEDGLGMLVRLWCWTASYYPNGEIPGSAEETLARVVAGPLAARDVTLPVTQALVTCGLLDRRAAGYAVHDWQDFQVAHVEHAEKKRAQNAERQRRFRGRNAHITRDITRDVPRDGNAPSRGRGEERRGEKRREEKKKPLSLSRAEPAPGLVRPETTHPDTSPPRGAQEGGTPSLGSGSSGAANAPPGAAAGTDRPGHPRDLALSPREQGARDRAEPLPPASAEYPDLAALLEAVQAAGGVGLSWPRDRTVRGSMDADAMFARVAGRWDEAVAAVVQAHAEDPHPSAGWFARALHRAARASAPARANGARVELPGEWLAALPEAARDRAREEWDRTRAGVEHTAYPDARERLVREAMATFTARWVEAT